MLSSCTLCSSVVSCWCWKWAQPNHHMGTIALKHLWYSEWLSPTMTWVPQLSPIITWVPQLWNVLSASQFIQVSSWSLFRTHPTLQKLHNLPDTEAHPKTWGGGGGSGGASALTETRLRSRACTGNALGDLTEFGEDLAKLEAEPEPNKTEEIEGSQVHPAFSWPVLLFSSTQLAAHQLPDCSATPVALGPLSSSLTWFRVSRYDDLVQRVAEERGLSQGAWRMMASLRDILERILSVLEIPRRE